MNQIQTGKPDHADLDSGFDVFHSESNEQVTHGKKEKSDGLLAWGTGFQSAFAQERPYGSQYRSQCDDHDRIERLEISSRHFPASDVTVGLFVGKEGE